MSGRGKKAAEPNDEIPKVVSPEEAIAVLQRQRSERLQSLQAELSALLTRYNARILPRIIVTGNQVEGDIALVLNE